MQNTDVQPGGNVRSVGGLSTEAAVATRPACILEGPDQPASWRGGALDECTCFTSLMSLFITVNICYFFCKK